MAKTESHFLNDNRLKQSRCCKITDKTCNVEYQHRKDRLQFSCPEQNFYELCKYLMYMVIPTEQK